MGFCISKVYFEFFKYFTGRFYIKQKAFISKEWVFNFFLLRGIITKLGQSWTLHSLTAQERLLVILYRRKIYSSLEKEWCVVVVSNAYCTNLWGTFFVSKYTKCILIWDKTFAEQKKSVYAPSLLLCMYTWISI